MLIIRILLASALLAQNAPKPKAPAPADAAKPVYVAKPKPEAAKPAPTTEPQRP